LINLLLLCVASTMSDEETDVNIIPEYPITKTILAENHSFGGVVDFLMAKLPAHYTSKSREPMSVHMQLFIPTAKITCFAIL
jgi:hypothetical protein